MQYDKLIDDGSQSSRSWIRGRNSVPVSLLDTAPYFEEIKDLDDRKDAEEVFAELGKRHFRQT